MRAGGEDASSSVQKKISQQDPPFLDSPRASAAPIPRPERVLQVVVTGGSRGIGRACVEAFANAHHRVLFTYNGSPEAAAAISLSYDAGVVSPIRLDQGDFDSVQAFAAEVDSWRGGKQVDVLLNNAALGSVTVERYVQADYLGDSKKESMKRRALEDEALMRVNALGPLWVTEALIDFMGCDKDRSAVLFIGSVGGGSQSVFPGFRPADAMSKAAVAHAVKLLAATHVHDEIDFMCVNPGATLTDMFKASTLDRMSEEERLSFTKRMPKSRLIAPSEIAEAVYWLATSPAARIFHGACFDASQGLAVRPGLLTELLNPC